ncbi:MAG: NAD(P)/FAD-dependent oxidoreductase [Bacillota bacterium]|nr:NAD(P)/FAD-dependent oxidoreductase [Bacillota bacterium]
MKVRINNIALPPDEQPGKEHIFAAAKIPVDKIKNISIIKQSVDARRKNNIRFIYSLLADVEDGYFISENNDVKVIKEVQPDITEAIKKYKTPPVIVGTGPAGLFCGYVLARYGYNPILIERGEDVDRRVESVNKFRQGGEFNAESNIQFGEGGAGTFSDGKLTTRINDFRCFEVLKTFCEFGAPEDILYTAKPHIGTDILRSVVKNMRGEIIRLGGKVIFNSKLTSVSHNGKLLGIDINGQDMPCEALVLAIGHSSRDTFEMLMGKGVFMEPKAFAVGVRTEHEQEFINRAQYGEAAGHPNLKAAEYFLKYNGDKHSCYSFCMCPGGEVVEATSEENAVVTNGMSAHSRNGRYANSGIVVTVSPADFGEKPLDGIMFQRKLENKAFLLGGENYYAPAQYWGDFDEGKKSTGDIVTTYKRGVAGADMHDLFPQFIIDTLCDGMRLFDRKIKGFAGKKVPLIGVESRTSSPVRITRGEDFQSVGVKGIYPCGEGAGYAGGIMSAAVDGIKVARKVMGNI